MLTFLRRVDLIQPPLTLNHRKVVVFVILGCFSWGEQRRGAGGFLCVGFAILAFSFCVVVDLFVGFLGFFLIILNVLLLASPKRRLLRSYERNHLERGGRVKREKSPKTVCSQRVYILCCLQSGLTAHKEIMAVISYPLPKHPSSLLSVSNLLHCLHHLSCQVPRPVPCFLFSLSFPFDHLSGIPQLMSEPP